MGTLILTDHPWSRWVLHCCVLWFADGTAFVLMDKFPYMYAKGAFARCRQR
ncbi:hypothetical protein [uncultured Adlercreutzia sp.]|uniref:hypothetical protein n=1 Tax=uncultured Adlercreutzia sp. TaxID=875803 RepID=UPI0026F4058D|nr:hypothetical protein [uncultured Adlercreutzia sp.]